MKNLLFVLAGILLLAAGCNTAPEETKTTELSYFTAYQSFPEHLNGQVKSVEEMNYLASEVDGEVVKGDLLCREMRDSLRWSLNFKVSFDENGNTLQVDRYFDEGDTRVWKLKHEGKQWTYAKFFRQDTLRFYWSDFEHNDLGQFIKAKYYNAKDDELLYQYDYTLNEDGNWKLAQGYDPDGNKTYSYAFDFNEDNLNTSYKVYNNNDSLLSYSEVEYNDKGFYSKAEYMNGLGEVRRVNKMEYARYDEMGNWIEVRIFDNNKLTFIAERTYEYY